MLLFDIILTRVSVCFSVCTRKEPVVPGTQAQI